MKQPIQEDLQPNNINYLELKCSSSAVVEKIPIGFSWVTFFFGFIIHLIRKNYKAASVLFIIEITLITPLIAIGIYIFYILPNYIYSYSHVIGFWTYIFYGLALITTLIHIYYSFYYNKIRSIILIEQGYVANNDDTINYLNQQNWFHENLTTYQETETTKPFNTNKDRLELRHPSGIVKRIPVGFSWTILFFSCIAPLIYKDYKNFFMVFIMEVTALIPLTFTGIIVLYVTPNEFNVYNIAFIAVFYGFSIIALLVHIYYATIYNKLHSITLLEKGYIANNAMTKAYLNQQTWFNDSKNTDAKEFDAKEFDATNTEVDANKNLKSTYKLELRHPSGVLKQVPIKFSWTTLFFNLYVPWLRCDFRNFLLLLLFHIAGISLIPIFTISAGICFIAFAFVYNKFYVTDLLTNGYTADNVMTKTYLNQQLWFDDTVQEYHDINTNEVKHLKSNYKLELRHPSGVIRHIPIGFSWTVLLFNFIVMSLRCDMINFIRLIVILSLIALLPIFVNQIFSYIAIGIAIISYAFVYNKLFTKDLLKQGFIANNAITYAYLKQNSIT